MLPAQKQLANFTGITRILAEATTGQSTAVGLENGILTLYMGAIGILRLGKEGNGVAVKYCLFSKVMGEKEIKKFEKTMKK